MSDIPENQISDWLKKLERESWQLELLVSAFTIFLLMIALESFDSFLANFIFQYNASASGLSFVYIFLQLLKASLQALTVCLVGHLMLRGFWIGTIGLRSVQSSIDFNKLNYNEFFTERLKKKVISLDQLVIKLDEICSVIFAFAFLVISMLLAFGMYLITLGLIALLFNAMGEIIPSGIDLISSTFAAIIFFTYLVSGIIYMIDYFTLGFFKKIKWFRKVYYPFYRFYNFITFSILSRSIYYYMISKFTKRRIRIVYLIGGLLWLGTMLFRFDQHQYFPNQGNEFMISSNYYDDQRQDDDYIRRASIESRFLDGPFIELFLRYDPIDNPIILQHCPEFTPLKDDGLNWRLLLDTEGGNFVIRDQKYTDEDFKTLCDCLSSIYQVSINDSIYTDLTYYFYEHPSRDQKGLLTTLSTDSFLRGENLLEIMKVIKDTTDNSISNRRFARIPFWYSK